MLFVKILKVKFLFRPRGLLRRRDWSRDWSRSLHMQHDYMFDFEAEEEPKGKKVFIRRKECGKHKKHLVGLELATLHLTARCPTQ